MEKAAEERKRYVDAWNETMEKIWRERITLLGIYNTGALLKSVHRYQELFYDDENTKFTVSQRFAKYGLYVNYGVGSNTPIGNPGDIGRDNPRKKKKWFSPKYYSSVMNMREYMAESIGDQFKGLFSDAMKKLV